MARSYDARRYVAGAPSKGATGARRPDRVRLRTRHRDDAPRRSFGRAHRIAPRYIAPGAQEYLSVAMSRRFAGDPLPSSSSTAPDDLPAARTHRNALTADAGGIAPGRCGRGGAARGAGGGGTVQRGGGGGGVASAGSGGTVTAVGTQGGTAAVMRQAAPVEQRAGARATMGPAGSPTAVLLAGHTFSLQLRVTPIN